MFSHDSYQPEYNLQKYIKSIWIVDNIQEHFEKMILPHDNVCLTFVMTNTSEGIKCSNTNLKDGIYLTTPSIEKYSILTDENIYYIDISFYPGVFTNLFNIPIDKIKSGIYNIKELSLNIDSNILEKLYEIKDNRFETLYFLNEYFGKLFRDYEDEYFLKKLFQLTSDTNLDNFFDNKYSSRHVQRKTKEFTGITPSAIAKINKFYKILKSFKYGLNVNFSLLALEYGFTDQSHFIKEFKNFTGKTPKQFLLENQEFMQYTCNIFV